MDVLSSRVILRPVDLLETQKFYREVLQLAVAREFGDSKRPGLVFFLGNGLLEVSGQRDPGTDSTLVLWLQVREVQAQLELLADRGATVTREARKEPWGLLEGWIQDPDGTRIVLVQVPDEHPIRRDLRQL